MKIIGKIFILTGAAVLLSWLGPWIYALATAKPYRSPFTLYSCVVDDFTSALYGGKDMKFEDRKGNVYGEEVQPMFYYRDLAACGMAPDSLRGRRITLEEVELNRFFLTGEPKRVAKVLAPVYILMESVPSGAELDDPEDAFVVRKDGIHVYDMDSNKELPEKTASFNSALDSLGFRHPAVLVAGNPSSHKDYDEGYLLTDSEGMLFHLRQDGGKPFAERFDAASGIKFKHLIITEFAHRRTLGLLVGSDNRTYMLTSGGDIVPTEVKYDPFSQDLLIVGDMFCNTVKVSDRQGEYFYALDSQDWSCVDTMVRDYPEDEFNYSSLIFPVSISFTSSDDGYVKPRFGKFSWWALLINAAVACVWVIIRRRRLDEALTEVPFILLGGPLMLVATALL